VNFIKNVHESHKPDSEWKKSDSQKST
jgi:hypothetical protein